MSNQDEKKQNEKKQNPSSEEVSATDESTQTEQAEDVVEESVEEQAAAEEVEESSKDEQQEDTASEESPEIETKEYDFNVGDTIVVSYKIQEDGRTRIQKFEGIVIAKKGAGVSKTFTMRRIGANNVGVERIFPLYSPNIADIEVKRRGKVRRAKLYYLRDRKGKAATYVKPANK